MQKLGFLRIATVAALIGAAIVSPAQSYKVLFNFNGINGQSPLSLIQGFDGNMYGTTQSGGVYGHGTVFKITARGKLTTLYSFCPQSECTDGDFPYALIQAADGSFYGTTVYGGDFSCNAQLGCGTVFKMTAGGTLTTLHSLHSNEGKYPLAGVIQARDGNFYGTTNLGGSKGYGTVFKITSDGTLTTVYNFCPQLGCPDGMLPAAGLIQATDGNFYGSTTDGGNGGTLFKITPAGKFTILHTFDGYDGNSPVAPFIQVGSTFYGTTSQGGSHFGSDNSGTVFMSTAAGDLTTLYNFCFYDDCVGYSYNGSYPEGLIQATDGNFYGTTQNGGNVCAPVLGCGSIFKITPAGRLTPLSLFCTQFYDCQEGYWPLAGLLQATKGTFYGTASQGGTAGYGTVFSLSVGLGPFVALNPSSGKVGWQISILGDNLKGTTGATFNGLSANFTVLSPTHIKATVPTGATTGTIQVTTPSGTLNSNVAFQILP